ncbi:MAG TPA: lipopolysaccharide heptosyltransferase I [Thermoanaerobaculia bacterium]|nr:lipopolysaccharide heptosyltransferase I [Thermoanaerobaculia bacterium]
MTRLLVIRLSALGDVVHTIPAVLSLRDWYDVSWIVEKPYAELVRIVAGVAPIPVQLKRWSLSAIGETRRAARGFDVVVDFQGLIKSALIARGAAPLRYGFAREAVREKPAAFFYNRKIKVDQTKHVVGWNLQLAAALLRNPAETPPRPSWSAFPQDPQNRLSELTHKIVLLPGAGRLEKLWPFDHFRQLVRHYGERAVVVWGPGEIDLARAIGGVLAPPTDLRELAFILQHAEIVIGGDTGPLHLADALGARVVGLYGPTDPRRNGPYSQLQRVIRPANTMEAIAVDDVVRKIEEVLAS